MSHTPGPWTLHDTHDGGLALVEAECLRITVDHREDFGRAGPDALLIAAAPELLAALNGFRWLGNNLHQIKQSPDEFKSLYESALEDAVKAVAKAEGK